MTPPEPPTSPVAAEIPVAPAPSPTLERTKNSDWRVLHLWQIQPIRDLLVIALIVAVVYVGARLSIVTVPMMLAILLAYLFEPLVAWGELKLRLSRPFAAIALILAGLLIIIAPLTLGAGLGIAQGARYVQTISTNVDLLMRSVDDPENGSLRNGLPGESWKKIRDFLVDQERKAKFSAAIHDAKTAARDAIRGTPKPAVKSDPALNSALTPPVPLPKDPPSETPGPGVAPVTPDPSDPAVQTPPHADPIPDAEKPSPIYEIVRWTVSWLRTNADTLGKQALSSGWDAIGGAIRTITSLGMFLFQAFLTTFFFYFFCSSWGRFKAFVRSLIPKGQRSTTVELVAKMDRAIAAFIRGRLTICAILMVLYTVGYSFIGVPAPLILGPIIAIFALFPYISSIGVPIAILLLWLEPNMGIRDEWWWTLLMPCAVFMCAQLLDDYVLTPAIQGKGTDMSTPVILFASIAGGVLGGFYGLLLAIPVAACLKIVVTDVLLPRIRAWSEGRASDVLPIDR